MPVEIYMETTPNPASLKFVLPGRMLLANNIAEFTSEAESKSSPLANALFKIPFVNRVFISNNFITISKKDEYEWYEIQDELKDAIRDQIESGQAIVDSNYFEEKEVHTEEDGSIQSKITDLLEKYVKPAIEMDGGYISFKSYDEGVVTVQLQGACSGCPSSMVTLKGGIEGLLKRMIPEVKEVVAEEV
ncbi:MAG: NifU family protein [Chitinophagales bacterium]|nr:NifU family protein [Chitinophagales bacterium]